MENSSGNPGGVLAGCGCIVAISPIIMSIATAPFNSGADVWHWYLVSTVPLGGFVVIIGLIIAGVGGNKSATEDSASRAESEPTAGDAESDPTAGDAP
jgi:hypothetical protein